MARARARGTKSRLRKLCALAPLPDQSSTSTLVGGELWIGTGALRNAREAEIRTYGSSVCFLYTHILYIYVFLLHERLDSSTDYRTWNQICKFATRVWDVRQADVGA